MGSPSAHNGSSKGRVGSIPTATTTINNVGIYAQIQEICGGRG